MSGAEVSVVIPAHNPDTKIVEAIDSALGQTRPPLEVVVVDDGSTSDLAWLTARYGDRIRYVRKPNGGPASARNLGLRLARGSLIAFLDADDIWEPDKLAAQLEYLAHHPDCGLVFTDVSRIDADGRPVGPWARRAAADASADALFMKNVICTSTVVVRRACLEAAGPFDEAPELIAVEDYDLWLRVAECSTIGYLARPLTRYRVRPAGISRNIARSYRGEALVVAKAVARRGAHRVPRARYRRRMARMHFDCAHEYFSANRWLEARAEFSKSLADRPWNLRAVGFWCATWLGARGVQGVRAWKAARAAGRNRRERPLRVLHVLNTVDAGGAEHVVLNLVRWSDPRRIALTVCSLGGRGTLTTSFERAGAPVAALQRRAGVDWRLPFRLAALIRRRRIDVVHTHNAAPWIYGGLAARLTGARLVHTEHSNLFPHQARLMAAERWLTRVTDRVVADSERVRRSLLAQGIAAGRVTTVVNGIDTAAYAANGSAPRLRSELGVHEQPVIGTVGRLVPVKDHRLLLEAFARVRGTIPDAMLMVVGDGPERAALKAQATRLGLYGAVRLVGERRDVAELLHLFDVFALSSKSEGMPLSLLEAMAAGKPVVATRVGGIPEAVTDGETGWLVPPGDPAALAAAIGRLLADAPLRKRLGAQAQAHVRAHFDLARMVEAYEAAYRH